MNPIQTIMKKAGDDFWKDQTNIGPIPNGDGTFRYGPKMTVVYDNKHRLFNRILIVDAIVAAAWLRMIVWVVSAPTYMGDFFITLVLNCLLLGAITIICTDLTIMGIRAKRLMIVVGNEHIKGMHDDWPVYGEEPEAAEILNVGQREAS